MDEPGSFPAEGAPLPPETAEELFSFAETARHRQVWEEAIRLYRFSLKKNPGSLAAIYGLALSFEGKSREPGYESYLQSAMAEYRKMIALDPSQAKAHDGLLAAAVKADILGDLLEEYKALVARDGRNQSFRDAFRKIQTLFLLKTSPVKQVSLPPPPIVSLIFGLLSPGVAVLALAASLLVRLKGESAVSIVISQGLIKISITCFLSFVAYKMFLFWRSNR